METKKSILVTRTLETDSLIRKWADENGIPLIEKSFIQTVSINGLLIPETDWIFFSSPQSVNLYFEHYSLCAKKIAALSEGTAAALSKLNQPVSFTGNSAHSTKETGIAFFNQLAENELTLFPLSDISKRNVSSQKGAHAVIELITYKTELVSEKINETPAVILFTSPSNADGFLLKNKIDASTKILAIGETTAAHLKHLGYKNIHISNSTKEESLLNKIRTFFE